MLRSDCCSSPNGERWAWCQAQDVISETVADHATGSQSTVLDDILECQHNTWYPGVLTHHSDFSSFLYLRKKKKENSRSKPMCVI